ncbi:hypothetical protein [Defluviimonas salinarum]|uniref:MASE1 protein n=1 Tax=Defluviimonas salinarum TaxID=2992147 RepID=A0ABT3J0N3_9RHOB|nr:hypothetical protein [Defluviimonas salinarum]MCW3781235.1 hypothetical protein [Defluviimonas salinarum]
MKAFRMRWGLDARLVWLVFASVFFSILGYSVCVVLITVWQSPGEIGRVFLFLPWAVFGWGPLIVVFIGLKATYAFPIAVAFWSACFRFATARGLSRRRAAQIAAAATGFGFWAAFFAADWADAGAFDSWKRSIPAFAAVGSVSALASALAATMIYRSEPEADVRRMCA